MLEKREGQSGRAADTTKSGTQLVLDLAEIVRAEVSEFAALHVAPHELGRVQIGRVAGQALDREPGALSAQVRLHGRTLSDGRPSQTSTTRRRRNSRFR